jgi:ribosomal protein S18 acetylase RimI-like enzyme
VSRKVRDARPDDAAGLAQLHYDVRVATYTGNIPQAALDADSLARRRALWEERVADPARRIVLAEDGGRMIGLACAGPMPERPNGHDPLPGYDAYLYSLYVDPGQQGSGLGKALLGAVAARLVADGLHAMALHTVAAVRAQHFYEHLGAHRIRTEEAHAAGVHWTTLVYGWDDIRTLLLVETPR